MLGPRLEVQLKGCQKKKAVKPGLSGFLVMGRELSSASCTIQQRRSADRGLQAKPL